MTTRAKRTAEGDRLDQAKAGKKWRRWGTYLSERQWGTVREDYSPGGDAWESFSYEEACLRAYRWGEDGLLGLSDNRGLIAFAPAFWNGKDPILKERLFGLTGPEGNHGEDVKELYFYLDATPTHSYARALYKYPQREFPYARLREEAQRAGRASPETEIWSTGVFSDDRYFDIDIEYAKADIEDVLAKITITNRGPEAATLHVLPSLWFRNTWTWEKKAADCAAWAEWSRDGHAVIACEQSHLGARWLYVEGKPELLFTENETNHTQLYGSPNASKYTKEAFHRRVVHGDKEAVSPTRRGTKAAAWLELAFQPGETKVVRARLTDTRFELPFAGFDEIVRARLSEADAFYASVTPTDLPPEQRAVHRQALGGLLWTKQFYHFDVDRWLRGDPAYPTPPASRLAGRNREWKHLYNSEILSVPDKWEYPWYAAWDLAFHCIPLAIVDPEFAKGQLGLLTREWYMHPNGQLPAYEWAFGDVNPPVHAWAALRVYQIERRQHGGADRAFLESVFHKLMLNFTWWVNRKDAAGNNVFEGGFLGLDNIGVFDRSNALPEGGQLEQADATSWMGMYCLNLLTMALELARENPSYQDVANKFFEHFLYIARAMTEPIEGAGKGTCLWDEDDGFFYDVLHLPSGPKVPMKLRSMVGLIPLFAVETVEAATLERFPAFMKRMRWFITNRPELGAHAAQLVHVNASGDDGDARYILALLDRTRLVRVLARMLDEDEFLSPYGIRALSRVHRDKPYEVSLGGAIHRVEYEPAESSSGLFGGNSNWRGPIWFPVNFLIIEALQKFHHFYGDDLKVECPTGSGNFMNLWDVASEISRRLTRLFLRDAQGKRPADGEIARFATDPHFKDYVTFYEYFHGDTGAGVGATHQTGWTALVAKLLQQSPLWKN
jgi:Glycosyl hydrolase family 63 C-terminal domain